MILMMAEQSLIEEQVLSMIAKNPAHVLYVLTDYDRLSQRVDELERRMRENNAVDARRSSIDLSAKAGSFGYKFYFDPFAAAAVNDQGLAEACRNYYNTHGVWPDGCTQRTIDLAERVNNGGA